MVEVCVCVGGGGGVSGSNRGYLGGREGGECRLVWRRVVVCVWKAGWCENNQGGTGMGEAAERGGGGVLCVCGEILGSHE